MSRLLGVALFGGFRMSVQFRQCCAGIAVTAAIAVAAAATISSPHDLWHHSGGTTYRSVNLSLLTLAGLDTGLATVEASAAEVALGETVSSSESTLAVAPATAATGGDLVYDLVQTVVSWSSFALLPLWWIAFPVTFPIGFLVGQQFLFPAPPNYVDFMGLRSLGIILSAVALPPILAGTLFPTRATSTVGAASTASAEKFPAADSHGTSGIATAAGDSEAVQARSARSERANRAGQSPKRTAPSDQLRADGGRRALASGGTSAAERGVKRVTPIAVGVRPAEPRKPPTVSTGAPR